MTSYLIEAVNDSGSCEDVLECVHRIPAPVRSAFRDVPRVTRLIWVTGGLHQHLHVPGAETEVLYG